MTQREATAALRERIVDAAIGQLVDEGMRGLTHRKVEARCGITQGLVKYHFGGIDALVEAVLRRILALQLPFVLDLDDRERADLAAGNPPSPQLLARAAAASEELWSQLDLAKARFEIYLYAYRRPGLQAIIALARGEFVERIAETLPGGGEAGARMLAALADGLLLDELSAPEPMLRQLTPAYLFAAGAAASALGR